MKQTIAIIGATGNMGSALSHTLAKGPYRLLLMSQNAGRLSELEAGIRKGSPTADIEGISCSREAGWEADIIIIATPYAAEKQVAEKIREVASRKIVVSISNPLNETYDGLVTSPGTSAAEQLQELLPASNVVKAFNTTFAADFSQPVIADKQVDAFIAGDDKEALEMVSDLVRTAGFNPMIAGDLSVSRTLEQMQLLLIRLGMQNNYNWLAGWKVLHNAKAA